MNDDAKLSIDEVLDLATLTRRAASRWGSRTALVFDEYDLRLSFEDIDRLSNQYANALRDLGVAPGDRVALMLRNRPEFPLAWLGIVKAGGVMVPLNVYYKPLDAGYLIDHGGVGTVICEHDLADVVAKAAPKLLKTGRLFTVGGAQNKFTDTVASASRTCPDVQVLPESLANIQYTSGTTGRPKGCMLSNEWFARFAWRVAGAQHGLSETDVLLTGQPFYYVDPQWNVALSLLVGACLVVLDRFHPSSFWSKIQRHQVTWFYCLGVMPKLLLKTPRDETERTHQVRWVACSGIPARDHADIEQRWGVPWYEVFGMTESGLDVTVSPEEHDALVGSGCIGRALPTREVRVVAADGRPAARNETGELAMRGCGLMDGYHRDAKATAETFRNGWLHTGDLARMDESGLVYFMGRKKDMIRRSGENIASAEVEEVITQHSSVRLAACVPVEDDLRGEEVKVYLVLADGETAEDIPPARLAEFCGERIAYFKIPRYWCYVTDLPRTPSERVIKSELTQGRDDLRIGAFDRVDGCWR